MAKLLAGTAQITVDGNSYMLQGAAKYGVSKVRRESLTGMDAYHGYKETIIPGFIEGTFRDDGGLVVANFNTMGNVTVVLQLANGKTIVGRNMACVDAQEVDSTEATFDLKFEGPSVTEQTAS
ncbi:phage tail tube protein [Bordetella bronchialis]|uniref:Phage tail protein n=1 Tax=Bordetella bronchialis TaxID=463025 RepID=A0A193FTF0_9BORD|nr:phage tail tube protein [Bordetella bronchialis]ANN70915.1 phage tail protein [Bordetella bronchialis]